MMNIILQLLLVNDSNCEKLIQIGKWAVILEMDDTSVILCTPSKIEGSSSDKNEKVTQVPGAFHVAIKGGLKNPELIDFRDWRDDKDITIPFEPITVHRCKH
jgi:hypothetical protein